MLAVLINLGLDVQVWKLLVRIQKLTVYLFFLRAQRERELENLKKTLETETHSFDTQLHQMKQKHSHQVEQFQEELDGIKRVCV